MKTKSELKWPLLLLLPITIIPAAVWRNHQTSIQRVIFTRDDFEGEGQALEQLSLFLKRNPNANLVTVQYKTAQDPHSWTSSPHETLGSEVWLYFLAYNREAKTVTKRLYANLHSEKFDSIAQLSPEPTSTPSYIWRWQNVDEAALHEISIRKRKTHQFPNKSTTEIEQVGHLYDLKRYGATLTLPN